MAVNGNAWAQQSDTHDGNVLRNVPAALVGLPLASHANAISDTARAGSYGIVGDGDFLVQGTGGLNYSVAAGRVVAPGTFSSSQGAYVGYNTSGYTATLAAHSAFIRHDLICYRVRDTDVDASGSEDDSITVVQGIAASTDPAIPASLGSLVILARATVPATSGTPTFTDLRQKVSALRAPILCTSAARPTGAARRLWQEIIETDTGNRMIWNGTAWLYKHKPVASYTPTITSFTQGNGLVSTEWHVTNGVCRYQGGFLLGSTTVYTGTFTLSIPLPINSAAGLTRRSGVAWFFDSSAGQPWPAVANVGSSASIVEIFNVQGSTNTFQISGAIPFAWGAGDEFVWDVSYPVA